MLTYENNTARSEESGASYTVDSLEGTDLYSLRAWVEAPEGSGLPDMDIAETSLYTTEEDAKAASEQIDQVAKKARDAMEVAHTLNAVLEQVQSQQQAQRPTYGVGHQGYALDGNPPVHPDDQGPTGHFGFH